jgi:hypothetical protein
MHKIKYNYHIRMVQNKRKAGIWLGSIISKESGRDFSHLLVGISG